MTPKSYDIANNLYIPTTALVTSDGSVAGVTRNFNQDVAFNLVPGYARAFGIGFNPDVDTATTPEDCWGGSGLYPWLPTNAVTMLEVVSTSANDTAAGSGTQQVSFSTLDINYNVVVQTVTMNGLTPVPLPFGCIRVNSGRGITPRKVNAGDIILRDVGGGTTRAIIAAGIGTTRQAPYTVPAGRTLAVNQMLLSVDSPTGAIGKFAVGATYFSGPTNPIVYPLQFGNTNGQPYNHEPDPPIMLSEKMDFSMVITNASDNNTLVTAAWNGILRTN